MGIYNLDSFRTSIYWLVITKSKNKDFITWLFDWAGDCTFYRLASIFLSRHLFKCKSRIQGRIRHYPELFPVILALIPVLGSIYGLLIGAISLGLKRLIWGASTIWIDTLINPDYTIDSVLCFHRTVAQRKRKKKSKKWCLRGSFGETLLIFTFAITANSELIS